MDFVEEFEKQWESLCNFLESEIITDYANKGRIDVMELEAKLSNEKRRWNVSGEYNYAWMEKLRAANPGVAGEVEKAIQDVRFEQIRPTEKISSLLMVGPAAGGAVIGYGGSRIAGFAAVGSLVSVVGLAAVSGIIGKNIYDRKKDAGFEQERSVYMNQLRETGKHIAEVVAKADAA